MRTIILWMRCARPGRMAASPRNSDGQPSLRYQIRSSTLAFVVGASTLLPTPHAGAVPNAFKADPKICARVGRALGHIPGVPPSLYVDSIEGAGRESIYQGVDVDGDNVADGVTRSCGSPSDGTCGLYVSLSTGGGYEFEEEYFGLIRFRSKYYVLVGDSYPEKNTRRRLYVLGAQGADLVCKSF